MIIKITNQKEWDALPKSFNEWTEIEVHGNIEIQATPGSSQVTAYDTSQVKACGSVIVTANSESCQLVLRGVAVGLLRKKCKVTKSRQAIVIDATLNGSTARWFSVIGVESKRGYVTLFKRVSKDFKTQEGTENETVWKPGATLTHENWEPNAKECGRGKFHACNTPFACDQFRYDNSGRYIAIKISIRDLKAWPNPAYPNKIAFRKGKVLFECDANGKEIKA